VGPLGFVPSPQGDVSPLFIVSSRAISPFSFIGFIPYIVENSLAGDELGESKNSQLPSLRQDFVRRCLEREEFHEPERSQMPSVWQSAGV
jgi:hypothetical protein